MTATELDTIARRIRVAVCAFETLGSEEATVRWLITPNRALGGKTPCEVLNTDEGEAQVLAVLTRIEHGVYS